MKIFLVLMMLMSMSFAQTNLRRGSGADLPAGMVMAHAGQSCPTGFLKADGTAISRTTYSILFASIGGAHGTGDGTTTFNLPDYRGLFLRMIDETKGNDPDKATRTAMNAGGAVGNLVGSVQSDSIQGHNHNILGRFIVGTGGGSFGPIGNNSNGTATDLTNSATTLEDDGTNGAPRSSTETRVKNAYVIYCVKF